MFKFVKTVHFNKCEIFTHIGQVMLDPKENIARDLLKENSVLYFTAVAFYY
jgi:hypothetical protein